MRVAPHNNADAAPRASGRAHGRGARLRTRTRDHEVAQNREAMRRPLVQRRRHRGPRERAPRAGQRFFLQRRVQHRPGARTEQRSGQRRITSRSSRASGRLELCTTGGAHDGTG